MKTRQETLFGSAMILPALAVAVALFMPVSGLEARDEVDCSTPNSCEYASKCYSHNACVKTGCEEPRRQVCYQGSFGDCGTCSDPINND